MTAQSVSSATDGRGDDASTFVHVSPDAEVMRNLDLYNTMTPPAYAQSIAGSQIDVEAITYDQEKLGLHITNTTTQPYHDNHESPRTSSADSPHILHAAPGAGAPDYAVQNYGGYFTDRINDAAIAYIRRCSVLPDRPAVWLVKKKNFALSSLAGAVLLNEGLLRRKDLVLISQHSGAKRDPTDPLSAVCFATYDTVGDVMTGLIAGPMEAYRQVTPMLVRYEQRQNNLQTPNVRNSMLQESTPLYGEYSHSHSQHQPRVSSTPAHRDGPATAIDASLSPDMELQPDQRQGWRQPNIYSNAVSTLRRDSVLEACPNAAKQVAIGTGKGLGRIVGAGLKAPMTFTHGITRGFHNVPKLYGEQVREYENITDLRSGMSVSFKGFRHGVSDGLVDFFLKPIQGAQKEGVTGFTKGCGKGVGNLVCKSASGAIGLVGYSSVGVYKQLQGTSLSGKDSAGDIARYQGEEEYKESPKELGLDVVNRWCQIMMSQKV